LFSLLSLLLLAPAASAAPQLIVVRRLTDNCSECAIATHRGRAVVGLTRNSFVWHPNVDARDAVLRFSFAVEAPAVITIRKGSSVLFKNKLDTGKSWDTDVPAGTLTRADAISFSAEVPADATVNWIDPVILVPSAEPPRTNVLVIIVDALRADRLGGAHNAMPKTLAWTRRGAFFTRAYANAPWTLPSISTILTGVFPGVHNGGRRTDVGPADSDYDLNPKPGTHGYRLTIMKRQYEFRALNRSVPTFAEILGRAGYYTGAIYQNGYLNHPADALRGFDLALQYPSYFAETATSTALDWIAKNRNTRFAALVHYIEVHQWPTDIPPELRRVGAAGLNAEQRAFLAGKYDTRCANTDAQIDRLLTELKATQVLDNTVVVITADHGEAIAEYGLIEGHGAGVEEDILRVPLAVFGPAIKPARIATRVSLASVLPTLLDYTRVPVRKEVGERTLRPMMEGKRAADRDFISEFVLYGNDQSAVYSGKWKYVAASGKDLLFDLQRDPEAVTDVAAAHPDVTERLRRAFRKRQVDMLERLQAERDESLTLTPETMESLRSLGYIGGSDH
jgi:arylsulfatase A-like enzyme